jgi:hypothetical protein
MNDKPAYDNELKGRLWKQESANPKAPLFKGEFIINGQKKVLVVWPEQTPKSGGKPFHRVVAEDPKEGGGNYHNSPKPTEPKSPWPSGHGPSVYVPSPRPDHNQHKADAYAPVMDRDENLPF